VSPRRGVVYAGDPDKRQITIALKPDIYAAFAKLADLKNLSKAELGRAIIKAIVLKPSWINVLLNSNLTEE
jgi:hypothetical protein